MSGKGKARKTPGSGKPDRDLRLKAALKSNMAKRKAQARKRSEAGRSGDRS